MRRNKTSLLLLLALSLLFGGCVTPLEKTDTETSNSQGFESVAQSKEESSSDTSPVFGEVAEYTYDADVNEAVLTTGYDARYLILVNKEKPLSRDDEPAERVLLSCNTTYDMELESRAAAALYEMLREMAADGLDVDNDADDGARGYDVAVTSAYRSYTLQEELFAEYIETEMNYPGGFSPDAYRALGYYYIQKEYKDKGITRLTAADARRVAKSYSAEAGKSEHQTGLCVDFITEDMNNSLTTVFEEKPAFAWLSENAHAFGFILRYPKGKEEITGYTYEPWHYRFVGREVATEIYLEGLTLEEYLQK
ncbi:MAG: D-alanyl-D-alanine carboxypeptidase family protein [Ruminococcaceae bacterium]|nr:D-alanyl-D-alanine carboxypeptidase family protein [Oscillospiraceae bacterium]